MVMDTPNKPCLRLCGNIFEPMRRRREELANNLDYVWDILNKGGQKASEEAEKTMSKVRKAVGLR